MILDTHLHLDSLWREYTVSKLLGHHSIKMTERYAHLAPDYLQRAVDALVIFGQPALEPAPRALVLSEASVSN
jgi:hypothetical protein